MLLPRRIISDAATFAVAAGTIGNDILRSFVGAIREAVGVASSECLLPGERRTVQCRDGVVGFRYSPGIDPNMSPIIFIHGWGQCAESAWVGVINKITSPFAIIDLPGHGLSRGGKPFSFDLAADCVLAVANDLGWASMRLVGFSLGGPVALAAVERSPGRFKDITIVASTTCWRDLSASASDPYNKSVDFHDRSFSLTDFIHNIQLIPAFFGQVSIESLLHHPPLRTLVVSGACMRALNGHRWNDLDLPSCRWLIPEFDEVLSPEMQRKSALRLGAQIVIVPGARHTFLLSDPALLIDMLEVQAKSDL
jgi:pimeloyl-ACP methyl ester carboxylesterase